MKFSFAPRPRKRTLGDTYKFGRKAMWFDSTSLLEVMQYVWGSTEDRFLTRRENLTQ